MNKAFLINHRFLVDPSLNTLEDIKSQRKKTRLEPRLMKLLYLLCEAEGKLISRDFLIEEIWGNDGGADEGLSQAISFLRKILSDKTKVLIQTIPKKGYVLNATVLKDPQKLIIKTSIQKRKSFLRLAAICGIVVFAIIMLARNQYLNSADKKNKKELKVKSKTFLKESKKSQ